MKTMIFAATFSALVPGKDEWRKGEPGDDDDQHDCKPAAARQIVREQAVQHPCIRIG
jgi:hypothetical protein